MVIFIKILQKTQNSVFKSIKSKHGSIACFSLGLDPKLLAGILGSATGRCWSVDTYNPCPGVMPNVPSSNDYKVKKTLVA